MRYYVKERLLGNSKKDDAIDSKLRGGQKGKDTDNRREKIHKSIQDIIQVVIDMNRHRESEETESIRGKI